VTGCASPMGKLLYDYLGFEKIATEAKPFRLKMRKKRWKVSSWYCPLREAREGAALWTASVPTLPSRYLAMRCVTVGFLVV